MFDKVRVSLSITEPTTLGNVDSPMPKPCGHTGPKPNIRSAGFPQFEVDNTIVLNVEYAEVENRAGIGTPCFVAIARNA